MQLRTKREQQPYSESINNIHSHQIPVLMTIEPKDVVYPRVPTPKELELSRQLVDLQQEKDEREFKLTAQIQDLEAQIQKLQVRAHEQSEVLQSTKRDHVHAQQAAIEKERSAWKAKMHGLQIELDQEKNDKEAQRIWARQFVAQQPPDLASQSSAPETSPTRKESDAIELDLTDDVFARFAQSIALLPASQAKRVVRAGVLPFLSTLLSETRCDIVAGSVLLALVHLAIHQRSSRPSLRSGPKQRPASNTTDPMVVSEEIVKAGVVNPLVRIIETGANMRVLSEAARLCAALAVHIPNKRVLAAKNVVRFLIQRLMPVLPSSTSAAADTDIANASNDLAELYHQLPLPGDPHVHKNLFSALVNLSFDSEILRSQIVNCDYFAPLAVRYVRESACLDVQVEASKLLGNLAANHIVNQSAIMTAEGDAALTKRMTAEILSVNPPLVRACAIAIANLAHTSVNQLSIGYGDAMTYLLQLLVDSVSPTVLEAVATALTSLCHSNPLNKSRVAAQNGIQVLLYVVSQSHRYGQDESALVACCECLAVITRTKSNRQQAFELDGHIPICNLCTRTPATSALLLEASASAICALIPTAHERQAALADGRENKLETNGIALSALERAKHLLSSPTACGDATGSNSVPQWLSVGIETLRAYQANTEGSEANGNVANHGDDGEAPLEFHERSYFAMESATAIQPDELCPDFYD